MDEQTLKTCEYLYELAVKNGEKTDSYDSERSEGEATGYGSRHGRTHYTLADGAFVIKATSDQWVRWNPTADWNGTTRQIEVFCGGKSVFMASCDGNRHVQRFSAGDERYAGSKVEEATPWKIFGGDIEELPAKYMKKSTTPVGAEKDT